MRVSLINGGLHPKDAVGTCVINQARYFMERGHRVRIYLSSVPAQVSAEIDALTRVVPLKEILEQRHEHFMLSDLYIYHYGGRYDLVETMRGIERGTVVFNYHNVTPPELWGTDVGREWLADGVAGSALAHYADFCLADSPFNKQDLIDRLGYSPERIYVLPLAVDLAEFTPGVRDPGLVERYGLHGQRVLVYVGRMAGNKRIDLLIEALNIDAEFRDVHYNLAIAYWRKGRVPEAMAELEMELALHPDHDPAKQAVAQLKQETQDTGEETPDQASNREVTGKPERD